MNPLRADTKHNLHFLRYRPGLFEEKIRHPHRGMVSECWRRSNLYFEPVLNGCKFKRDRRTEAFPEPRNVPTWSHSNLKDGQRLFFNIGLRKHGWSERCG